MDFDLEALANVEQTCVILGYHESSCLIASKQGFTRRVTRTALRTAESMALLKEEP